MQLAEITLTQLATMICGDKTEKYGKNFPYRSSSYLTSFFQNCGLPFRHDGSTRRWWVLERLKELQDHPISHPDLPSESLVSVILGIIDEDYFQADGCDRELAIQDLNRSLIRNNLEVLFDEKGRSYLNNDGASISSSDLPERPRPLTADEKALRKRLEGYLDKASEDDFTQNVLVPFFQRRGFHRVDAAGHREKTQEFGKDLWMKFLLPTGHWLYFCAQVKRVKIHSRGVGDGNITEVLNQVRMAMDHAIFDPDINKRVLLDHLFVISAAEITRQARQLLIEKLDKEQRRHIIFMDRSEFLDHAARILADLQLRPTGDDLAF